MAKLFARPALALAFLVVVLHFTQHVAIVAQHAGPDSIGTKPPVQLTAEEDHRRMMDLLHITSIRRGPSGNPQAPDAANFDESKANPYPTLPDPLVANDGTPVKTPAAWWQTRRAEIVEDFDREVYGRMPAQTPTVKWELVSTIEE